MKKLFILFIVLAFTLPIVNWGQTNPGFESGNLTGWKKEEGATGEVAINTTNIRTGSYSMSYTTNTATTYRIDQNTSFSVPNNSYIHVIAWAKGSNNSANGTISIYTTGWYSASLTNIGTEFTQLSFRRQNSSGSVASLTFGLTSSRSTGGAVQLSYIGMML